MVRARRVRASRRAMLEVLAFGAKKKCHASVRAPRSSRATTRPFSRSPGRKPPRSRGCNGASRARPRLGGPPRRPNATAAYRPKPSARSRTRFLLESFQGEPSGLLTKRMRGTRRKRELGRALRRAPVERDGHLDRWQEAQTHRALVGAPFELRSTGGVDGRRALGWNIERYVEPCHASWRRRHLLQHADLRARQRVIALAGEDAHDRGHAGAERRGEQIGRGETLAAAVVIDGCVGLERLARRAVNGMT